MEKHKASTINNYLNENLFVILKIIILLFKS